MKPFKLERFFARYEFKAPYLLSSSDCESRSIQDVLDLEPGAAERFQRHWLGYTDSQGSPELRQVITGLYEHITPDDILVHAGAEEAIFNFAHALLEPGDHVIVHVPCYQSLAEVARSIGCTVTPWITRQRDSWELDVDWLEQAIQPNTRAIFVNCPHNPTGYLMNHDKQARILDIARERKLLVFSDEVYRGLEYDAADRLPAACDRYENAVSLGVMSKTYGLAGLRIGWIATRNREVYCRMAGMKDYLSICNSAPSEFLAAVALRHRDTMVARNRAIILHNLALLDDFFARHAALFDWAHPKAGSVAFPGIHSPAEAFCVDVVERQGVMLLPSACFDAGDHNFRIGFGRSNLPDALQRLDDYLHRTNA